MSITEQSWGQTPAGAPVALFTLTNHHGVEARISAYGGAVVSLRVPDRHGQLADIVLGFDTLASYLGRHPYFGVLVGRVANRIRGARFTLSGVAYQLSRNEGHNQLHGGVEGFDRKVWDAAASDTADGPQLHLAYLSPEGEEGYPGALRVDVTYTLTDDNGLRIDYTAVPDHDTPVSLTNHSYFNLAGAGSGTVLDHVITIDADAFTPTDDEQLPTGELRPVAGTPFDFRQPTPIGQRIHDDDEQLRRAAGYDHNWVLASAPRDLTRVVEVFEPTSGRVMEVWTTAPGVQLYTANKLGVDSPVIGKGGRTYHQNAALCLETQHPPDAVNQPGFPSPIVRAGETYRHTTVYRFSTR